MDGSSNEITTRIDRELIELIYKRYLNEIFNIYLLLRYYAKV